MVRTRSPVRIWLSAPKKTPLTTRDVFFGAVWHLRQKHSQQRGVLFSSAVIPLQKKSPITQGTFFWSRGASPSKALPTKRSAFSSAVFHLPQKHSLQRGRFFGAMGHLRQKHSQQRGVLFLPLCFIFLKKHVQKLGLKLSSVGLFSINTLTFGVFFCKVLCLPLMCSQKRPTVRNRAFLFFAICFQRFARRFG